MAYTKATRDGKSIQKYEIPSFDLERLNLLQLAQNLEKNLNKKQPVFFKAWGNNRLRLDLERQEIIAGQIRAMSQTAKDLAEMQASVFLSQEMLESNLEVMRLELKMKAERMIKEHELALERLDFENERLGLENKRLAMEIEQLVHNLDMEKNIPDEYKPLLAIIKAGGDTDVVAKLEELKSFKDFILEERLSDLKLKQQEAEQAEIITENKRWTFQQKKKNIS